MKLRKVTALMLAVCLIFCFAGCKREADDTSSKVSNPTESKTRNYMTLLYSAADTFNPYEVETDINRQLCKLLYEPLVKLNNEFEPVNSLAYSIKVEEKVCTVVIRDAVFSDGSAVTASDVVYSFNLAKASEGVYASKLYSCSKAEAADGKTVIFTLEKNDPYFINLLDFPVLKSGSEKITDSDSVLQPPIGCGRFKVNETRNGLVINESYYGNKSSITEIKLINSPDIESVSHYVEVGAADMYYSDISDGNILRMSGNKIDINLNNLVYIGINSNYGALANTELRQALSSGIDRVKISRDAFYNNALAATGFFNPVWKETKSLQNIQIEANSQITIENLDKIGYNVLDEDLVRVNASGTPLRFTLLVNSENRIRAAAAQMIADQLAQYGIKIAVIEKNYEAYLESLKSGDFQLFLGEVKLTDNMDFSSLITKGGSAAYGIAYQSDNTQADNADNNEGQTEALQEEQKNSGNASAVIEGFYAGENTVSDVATVLQTEMPLIPVCYRTGVLFCNDNIENVTGSSASDIYFSIESYKYNN